MTVIDSVRQQSRPSRFGAAASRPWTWTAITLALLLVLWLIVTAGTGLVPERVLPSPVAVLRRFAELAVHSFAGTTLIGHIGASLSRWVLGVLVAVLFGVPLGFLLAWIPVVRSVIAPAFELLRYIPPFAWIPIAVLWMGANTSAQALVVFISAFPAIVINSRLGVTEADPLMSKAARCLGAGSLRTLITVVSPVAAASALTGVRIGFGNGWMALVGAELIVGKQGLGNLILQGQANLSTPTILVGMVTIGVVATAFDALLQTARRRLFPWSRVEGGN